MEEREAEIRACAFCNSMCRHVCTVATITKLESTQPKGKGMIAYSILRGEMEFTKGAIERMYMCVDCGRCKVWCVKGASDCSKNVQAVRADIAAQGKAPAPISKWRENVLKHKDLYGAPLETKFLKIRGLPKLKRARTLYFIGCTTAKHQPEIAEATLTALRSLNEEVSVMKGEACCGYPLWVAGFREEAKKLARENASAIEETKVEQIVVSCPECYLAFKECYREWGSPLSAEVFHITDYLVKLGFKPLKELAMRAVYHDPCHLGRRGGIYDQPRGLLASVPKLETLEMRWSRENSLCCGGGGGLQVTYPRLARAICDKALKEASKTGAEALITACPFCKQMFNEGVNRGFNLKVYDITEVLVGNLKV